MGRQDDFETAVSIVCVQRPDIVYLGLPFDMALRLAGELRARVPSVWCVGFGVSFSFISGDITRAPRWMQEIGLEWLHRVAHEPRRLMRRYIVEGPPFAARLFTPRQPVVGSGGSPR